jgi:hypothetical protein
MQSKSSPDFMPTTRSREPDAPIVLDVMNRLILVGTQPHSNRPDECVWALLNGPYPVTVVNMSGLFALAQSDPFPIAVLSDRLGPSELIAAAQFVRRQWPQARILVLGQAAPVLGDNLYDDSIAHSCEQVGLLKTLARLSFNGPMSPEEIASCC